MNINLQCAQHKISVTKACLDLTCNLNPFYCDNCDKHSGHQTGAYDQFLRQFSERIEKLLPEMKRYRQSLISEEKYLRYFQEEDLHIESFIRSIQNQKLLIEQHFKQAIDMWTKSLMASKEGYIQQLDDFQERYVKNFKQIKEIIEPISFLVNKCRYFSNENNLRLKLHSQSGLGSQLKMCLQSMKTRPDQLQNILKLQQDVFGKLWYNSDGFDQTFSQQLQKMSDYFKQNIQIPELMLFQVDSPLLSPKKSGYESSIQDETTIEVVEKTQPLPSIANVQIIDHRILIETQSPGLVQNVLQKQLKFKIKKKISLDFQVNTLALVGNYYVALGLKEGNMKLLDLQTSKVSFYPNTYMCHQKEINNLIILKQNRGTKLASCSNEPYVIVWTLGENNVPYPERKLGAFSQNIIRIMDLADGSHIVCQSTNQLIIVNYHDNRPAHKFDTKGQIIDFLYVSKFEKFAAIYQNNLVQIYGMRMNQVQVQNILLIFKKKNVYLLMNVTLEHTIQALHIGNICSSIATDFNQDIVICYGCSDGSVKLFNVLKNIIIADIQLFRTRIIELIILKQKKSFTLVALAEGDKQIRGIQVTETKFQVIDRYGDMIEMCCNQNGKHVAQVRGEGRCGLLILCDNQKDIGIYELC